MDDSVANEPCETPATPGVGSDGTDRAISSEGQTAVQLLLDRLDRDKLPKRRASRYLTGKNVEDVKEGALFAWAIGLPLNRFITISFEVLGVTENEAATVLAGVIKRAKDWLRTKDGQSAHLYVREVGGQMASHVHLLFHVPPELGNGFVRRWKDWLRQASGRRLVGGSLRSRWVGKSAFAAWSNPSDYLANLAKATHYISKGAEPTIAHRFGVARFEDQGLIVGKRCGLSENIHRKARAGDPRFGSGDNFEGDEVEWREAFLRRAEEIEEFAVLNCGEADRLSGDLCPFVGVVAVDQEIAHELPSIARSNLRLHIRDPCVDRVRKDFLH